MTTQLSAVQLNAADLACTRGGRLVFQAVSFELRSGAALLLRGPNGSGKSSLLRMLAGLLLPSAGALRWDGVEIAADRDAHRARIGYLGMLDALKPGLTVAENLSFHAQIHDGEARMRPALDALGMAPLADTPARRLSQGQRRRAALARLLIGPGALWLLDEPTLALDSDGVERLGRVLASHLARGGMAVIATHVDLPAPHADTLTLGVST